ncbi:MAG TPA: SDR family oxidoreductase [Trueperaceae bacterium]
MNLGLEGKRALVTAASGGLGFATARALAQEGAKLAICSRDEGRAAAAAGKIGDDTGAEVHSYAADVSDAGSLEELFGSAVSALGGLDIMVCNAGGPPPGGFARLGEEEWDRAYQLTLQSVVRSVRLAVPHMRQAGGGSILALGSSSVKSPIPNLLLSNVFRPAVHGLCKSLSVELAGEGIRVNLLSPGRVETERIMQLDRARAENEGKPLDEVKKASLAAIPLGRLGRPEEFGRVAAFLLSDAASYMTGSSVIVDGGMVSCL